MKQVFCTLFIFCSAIIFALGISAQVPEEKLPAPPNPPRLVSDFADMLSDAQESALENKLVAYDDSTSTQIAVVTIESLNGYPIEMYSVALLRYWGIGRTDQDNGVLLLISDADREVRIETGSGSEVALTDALSRRIIEQEIVPRFQNGNFYDGIDLATTRMMEILAGQFYNEQYGDEPEGNDWGFILIVILIILLISFINRNKRGMTFTRRGPTYWGGGGFGGFGGFGGKGGGGGFGGFGGGFGGGGGASGRW